jgi:hypothetical protein
MTLGLIPISGVLVTDKYRRDAPIPEDRAFHAYDN